MTIQFGQIYRFNSNNDLTSKAAAEKLAAEKKEAGIEAAVDFTISSGGSSKWVGRDFLVITDENDQLSLTLLNNIRRMVSETVKKGSFSGTMALEMDPEFQELEAKYNEHIQNAKVINLEA